MRITSLGHATFRFVTPESKVVLVDPWTYGNPLCPEGARDVGEVDLILITHGHHDHLGDVFRVAERGAPKVVAVAELGNWLSSKGLKNTRTMNVGGIVNFEGVRITMTPAEHSSSVDEDPGAYVGVAAGFVLQFSNGTRVYHAGDTAAFPGMELIHEVYQPDLALLPMGDQHTMGPAEAAVATRLLKVGRVVPMHYGIAPGSSGVPAQFRHDLDSIGLGDVEMIEMRPGQSISWG
ncbi:MAG TPA: metal-dependent hydrolase [Planosporangium sp.]|nr:metal-dependent hydrolase [Planosporangium sp.]